MLKNRKKIVHVIESLGLGGAEKLLFETVRLLPDFEHVIVFFNKNESFDFSKYATLFHIEVSNQVISYLKGAWELKKFIKQQKPDIVHSHLWTATLIARLATPKATRLISTIHSIYSRDAFNGNPNSLRARIERLTYRKYHEVIGVSNTVLRDYFSYVPQKGPSYLLYNFIQKDYFHPITEEVATTDTLKIISIGNLRTVKNYEFLLQALSKIPANSIRYTWDIYGEGDLRDTLQRLIDRHQLPIRLCGHQYNLEESLSTYDLFVAASRNEGFCLALGEAMAAGVPLLIADIPTFRELTADLATYFSPTDEVDFANKLHAIVELKKRGMLKAHTGAAQQRIFNVASEQQYKQRLLTIYEHPERLDPAETCATGNH